MNPIQNLKEQLELDLGFSSRHFCSLSLYPNSAIVNGPARAGLTSPGATY
jgi:hypothetical protein